MKIKLPCYLKYVLCFIILFCIWCTLGIFVTGNIKILEWQEGARFLVVFLTFLSMFVIWVSDSLN